MSNTLYNKDGAAIPPRPEMSDALSKFSVLEAIRQKEVRFEIDHEDVDQFVLDFQSVWKPNKDGYLMAKEMESKGYKVDLSFALNLEKLDEAIHSTLFDAELDWCMTYEPVPPLAIGGLLQVEFDDKMQTLEIESVYPILPATYVALVLGSGKHGERLLVSYETALSHHVKENNSEPLSDDLPI